jgi:hypothetical protein
MTTPVAGTNNFHGSIAAPADGDPANAASFISVHELSDRTRFLLLNTIPAIAQHRIAESATSADRYTGACWGAGAGYQNEGLFCVAGVRSGGGAAISLSTDGEAWYDYSFDFLSLLPIRFRDVAHGGSGAFGDRRFAFCGYYDDSGTDRPVIFTASDAANGNANPLIPEIASGAFSGAWSGTPVPIAGQLNSICWNGTVWCAVGTSGLIVTLSGDLATATVRTPGSSYTGTFHHVFADSAGQLFACGASGEIQRSTNNGATWTRVHSDASLGGLVSGAAITLSGVESLVVGASAENKVLRSTNTGGTFAEVVVVPEATFPAADIEVFKLGAVLGAIVASSADDAVCRAYYSLDGGATWPYTCRTAMTLGSEAVAYATNGQRTILAGGSPDGTTAGHVFVTGQIFEAA